MLITKRVIVFVILLTLLSGVTNTYAVINSASCLLPNSGRISARSPSQRWALIIGIADYEGTSSDLSHTDDDAQEMRDVVLQAGYPEENVRLLLNSQASKSAIRDAIDWLLANEEAGDEVLFFFSGHGFRTADTKGLDTDEETDGYDEGIRAYDQGARIVDGWLRARFAQLDSQRCAFLFGSCHSGGMFDDDDDLQGAGRIILSACKANQLSWDYGSLDNTLWSYYCVDEGLLDGNAASLEEAHAYAYPRVVAKRSDSQPQLSDNVDGDFVL